MFDLLYIAVSFFKLGVMLQKGKKRSRKQTPNKSEASAKVCCYTIYLKFILACCISYDMLNNVFSSVFDFLIFHRVVEAKEKLTSCEKAKTVF